MARVENSQTLRVLLFDHFKFTASLNEMTKDQEEFGKLKLPKEEVKELSPAKV